MASGGTWSSRFPVYQIDFAAVASGKRVASTKRRIRWRFGFPNQKALQNGQTGTDCRGEEHDVTIVWSVTSGKRQVSMDGREVHYSTSRSGLLDYSWATKGNHVMKVIAHAAPPLSATPGFRQYDLLIDGQSFFSMPKVYELGIKGPIPSHARVPGANDYAVAINPTSPISYGSGSAARDFAGPSSREQEDAELQRAIQASIEESRRHLDKKHADDNFSTYSSPAPMSHAAAPAPASDLLDFGGSVPSSSPAPAGPPLDAQSTSSIPSYYSAPPTYNYNVGAQPSAPSYAPAAYQSPPALQLGAPVSSPNPPAYGGGGGQLVPAQAPPNYYPGATPPVGGAPPAYASPPPVPPVPAPTPEHGRPYGATPDLMGRSAQPADVFGLQSPPGDDPFAPKPPPPPTHNDIANAILGAYTATPGGSVPTTPGMPASTPGSHPPTQISPAENGHAQPPPQSTPLSMNGYALTAAEDEQPKSEIDVAMKKLVNFDRIDEPAEAEVKLTMIKKEEAKKAPKGKSKGLPPVAQGMVGSQATLSQIQEVKPERAHPSPENIMKAAPPNAYHSGAIVVHGQGPPPLQQARGFGVGAALPNGGFVQQQQQQAPMQGYYQQPYPGHPQYR